MPVEFLFRALQSAAQLTFHAAESPPLALGSLEPDEFGPHFLDQLAVDIPGRPTGVGPARRAPRAESRARFAGQPGTPSRVSEPWRVSSARCAAINRVAAWRRWSSELRFSKNHLPEMYLFQPGRGRNPNQRSFFDRMNRISRMNWIRRGDLRAVQNTKRFEQKVAKIAKVPLKLLLSGLRDLMFKLVSVLRLS